MNFAQKVKIARMLAGIDSMQKLAELVGVSYTTIQRIEAGLDDGGDYPLKAELKEKICNLLKIKGDVIMDEALLEKLLEERAKRAVAEDRLRQLEAEVERLKSAKKDTASSGE